LKRILYLTFYFEPDLCAGSFRNSPLVKELSEQFEGEIDVITTVPNRYKTFQVDAPGFEARGDKVKINRILIPVHKSGLIDQINSFKSYYNTANTLTKGKQYDLVFASSSRLFTAYLGYRIASKYKIPLYLDIRDIFTDTMQDVLKSIVIKSAVLPILKVTEKKVFNYASHINLISAGFKPYFDKYVNARYSCFSNGIDDEFLNLPTSINTNNNPKLITYAGNIGEGQGLHKIIPAAALQLGFGYKFIIIGDGGAKQELLNEIKVLGITNIEVKKPMKRKELIEIYSKSDFLFLHLNDYDAFKKVLPSKIFELGAFDKPIIAGVAGYANRFIEENISNKILFLPGDVHDMVKQLSNYQYVTGFRKEFIEKYKRSNIDKKLADSILSYL
jgi:hypothetical protein